MRRLLLTTLLVLACDAKEPADEEAKLADAPPRLPTPEEVCAVYKALPLPDNTFVLTATTTKLSIRSTFDGKGATAEISELRSESEPPEGDRQMHRGISVGRRLTMTLEGGRWAFSKEEETSRDRIFYVRRPVGDDPRNLFGAQVMERYGPKGGVVCIGVDAPDAQ